MLVNGTGLFLRFKVLYIYSMYRSLIYFSLLISLNARAQLPPSPDSTYLLNLNQLIDDLVVKQEVVQLDSLYAGDFVFSHGSGRIEGKSGWFRTVNRTRYLVRKHDSVSVQQHKDIAVVKGSMYIERQDKAKPAKYQLRYIRIYAYRNGWWQLLSHNTIHEVHL